MRKAVINIWRTFYENTDRWVVFRFQLMSYHRSALQWRHVPVTRPLCPSPLSSAIRDTTSASHNDRKLDREFDWLERCDVDRFFLSAFFVISVCVFVREWVRMYVSVSIQYTLYFFSFLPLYDHQSTFWRLLSLVFSFQSCPSLELMSPLQVTHLPLCGIFYLPLHRYQIEETTSF